MQNDRTGLFSVAYLPPISYVAALLGCKKAVIEQQEFYPKQTFRNRCKILTANGIMDLSIPVERPCGNKTLLKDLLISHHENWQMQHWRAIESAYSNSPFFDFYKDDLQPFFEKKYRFLLDFDMDLLQKIAELMEMDFPRIVLTENYETANGCLSDFRNRFNPKKENTSFIAIQPPYYQVFSEKFGFVPDLSIVDLLFNLGNEAEGYLATLFPYPF